MDEHGADPGQRAFLDRAISRYLDRGSWPTLAALQGDLSVRRFDAAAILRTLPPSLTTTADSSLHTERRWTAPRRESQLWLFVAGLACRPAGRRVAEAFVAILDVAGDRFLAPHGSSRDSDVAMSLELDELTASLEARMRRRMRRRVVR